MHYVIAAAGLAKIKTNILASLLMVMRDADLANVILADIDTEAGRWLIRRYGSGNDGNDGRVKIGKRQDSLL